MVPKIVSAAIKSGIAASGCADSSSHVSRTGQVNNLNTIMQDLLNPQEKANQFAFNDIFFRRTTKSSGQRYRTQCSMAISESLLIIPGKYWKQARWNLRCPSIAMRLSILVTNGIRLWPMPCQSTNLVGVSSVVILPSRQSGRMLQRTSHPHRYHTRQE